MNNEAFSILEYLDESEEELSEGRGIVARSSTDVYTDKKGVNYQFNSAILFPSAATVNKIDSFQVLQEAIADYVSDNSIKILGYFGQTTVATKAAILAVFLRDKKKVGWVKYFNTLGIADGRGKWTDAQFYRDTGLLRLAARSTQSELLPIKPSHLLPKDTPLEMEDILHAVYDNLEKYKKKNLITQEMADAIYGVVYAAAKNEQNPMMMGQAENAAAINKYIGEIVAPIALVTGWNIRGSRKRSQEKLLPGEDFGSCLVGFPASAAENMYDSYLLAPSGKKIKVSSKAKVSNTNVGAASSMSSITAKLEEVMYLNPYAFSALQKKYGRIFAILTTIEKESAVNGVLSAAILSGIITETEKSFIQNLIAQNISLATYKKNFRTPERLERIANSQGDISPTKISATHVNVAYKPGFHLLAIVAKALGNVINSTELFSQAMKELLTYESFVQIISSVKTDGDDLYFEPFTVIYPPDHQGKIIAAPGKYFYSTGMPKGKFPFKIT